MALVFDVGGGEIGGIDGEGVGDSSHGGISGKTVVRKMHPHPHTGLSSRLASAEFPHLLTRRV